MTLETVDRRTWLRLAPGFSDHNYRQTWEFGLACAARRKAQSEHVAVRDGSETVALADVRIKRLPLVRAGVAYINGGPLVRARDSDDVTHAARLSAALTSLREAYVEQRGYVLRIAPPLAAEPWKSAMASAFEATGFKPSQNAAPYRTICIDLAPAPDAIRRNLDQKWRNCLNRAERNGLSIRVSSDVSAFADFCSLYDQLLARKQFGVDLDARFYAAVQQQLDPAEQFRVSLAIFAGRPVAGMVTSFLGDTAVYLLGASDEEGMRQKASYLLQWEALTAARAAECTIYDLGGIDPDQNPGVYHFKQGLGGTEQSSIGAYEAAPGAMSRWLVAQAESLVRRRLARPAGRAGASA